MNTSHRAAMHRSISVALLGAILLFSGPTAYAAEAPAVSVQVVQQEQAASSGVFGNLFHFFRTVFCGKLRLCDAPTAPAKTGERLATSTSIAVDPSNHSVPVTNLGEEAASAEGPHVVPTDAAETLLPSAILDGNEKTVQISPGSAVAVGDVNGAPTGITAAPQVNVAVNVQVNGGSAPTPNMVDDEAPNAPSPAVADPPPEIEAPEQGLSATPVAEVTEATQTGFWFKIKNFFAPPSSSPEISAEPLAVDLADADKPSVEIDVEPTKPGFWQSFKNLMGLSRLSTQTNEAHRLDKESDNKPGRALELDDRKPVAEVSLWGRLKNLFSQEPDAMENPGGPHVDIESSPMLPGDTPNIVIPSAGQNDRANHPSDVPSGGQPDVILPGQSKVVSPGPSILPTSDGMSVDLNEGISVSPEENVNPVQVQILNPSQGPAVSASPEGELQVIPLPSATSPVQVQAPSILPTPAPTVPIIDPSPVVAPSPPPPSTPQIEIVPLPTPTPAPTPVVNPTPTVTITPTPVITNTTPTIVKPLIPKTTR